MLGDKDDDVLLLLLSLLFYLISSKRALMNEIIFMAWMRFSGNDVSMFCRFALF